MPTTPGSTFSPGDTYRKTPNQSRMKERLAVVIYADRTSWHISGLREEVGWRSEAPFSPVREEDTIAQGILDAGYALRVMRCKNAVFIFVSRTIKPRRLFN